MSEGVIPEDHELVNEVYKSHYSKTAIMLMIYGMDQLMAEAQMGLIDSDDILKEAILTSEEEVSKSIAEIAVEIEMNRQEGVYVDVYEDDEGNLMMTSPDEFPKEKAERLLDIVQQGYTIINGTIRFMSENKEVWKDYSHAMKEWLKESE